MSTADLYAGLRRLEPVGVCGTVVHGFKRGSKELGIPTANLESCTCIHLPCGGATVAIDDLAPGVYLGFAGLRGSSYKMVMSIGWNPFYGNTRKTVEPHLLHSFEADFYDEELRLVILAFMRPEMNFPSLDALITAIRSDIDTASHMLDSDDSYAAWRGHAFLTAPH